MTLPASSVHPNRLRLVQLPQNPLSKPETCQLAACRLRRAFFLLIWLLGPGGGAFRLQVVSLVRQQAHVSLEQLYQLFCILCVAAGALEVCYAQFLERDPIFTFVNRVVGFVDL
jgi:hypothetical protein